MENRVIVLLISLYLIVVVPIGSYELYKAFQKILDHSTPQDAGHSGQDGNIVTEVSGPSIFWAIVAIAVYAMSHPSYTGQWMSGDTFADLLWPQRSSPMTCLIDMAIDMNEVDQQWQLHKQLKNAGPSVQATNTPLPSGASAAFMVRLAIFVLGVLPQAVKVFSMSGIYKTQILAGAFFFPSLWSLVRSAPLFQGEKKPAPNAAHLSEAVDDEELKDTFHVWKLASISHVFILYSTWETIAANMLITCSQDVRSVITLFELLCIIVSSTFTLQEAVRRPSFEVGTVKRTKATLFVLSIWLLSSTLNIFHVEGKNKKSWTGLPHLLIAASVCVVIARVLGACTGWIQSRSQSYRYASEDLVTLIAPPVPVGCMDDDTDAGDIGMQAITGQSEVGRASLATPEDTITLQRTSRTLADESSSQTTVDDSIPKILVHDFHRNKDICEDVPLSIKGDISRVSERLFIGMFEIWCMEPVSWFLVLVMRHKVEMWVAFTILNLLTAAIYYCWAFDGKGTYAPSWTQALG